MARSATLPSIAVETEVVMRASLLLVRLRYRCELESARRLNQRERGEPRVEQRRELGEAALIAIFAGRVGGFEIAPALMRALRVRRDQLELGRKHDVDPPIVAVG